MQMVRKSKDFLKWEWEERKEKKREKKMIEILWFRFKDLFYV